jgi:heme O synthase-like polyprenyltransferase
MSDQMRDVAAVPAEPEGGQQPSITGPPLAISGVADCVVLLKPRVLTLVVFTGIVGLVVAPGTPPHFWSLSRWAHADYRRAGVPMLPVVAGAKETRRQIVIYTVLLVALSVLPWALGEAGVLFGLAAAVLGLGFLLSVWRVAHDQQDASGVSLTRDMPARAAFRYSTLYLFALFAARAVDGFVC